MLLEGLNKNRALLHLGKKTPQLIIEGYSGGANCCYIYKVYDLNDHLTLIFDTDFIEKRYKHQIRNLRFVDINRDGIYEIILGSYFSLQRLPHIYNIYPDYIISYKYSKGIYDIDDIG